jgi:hypothetical protein
VNAGGKRFVEMTGQALPPRLGTTASDYEAHCFSMDSSADGHGLALVAQLGNAQVKVQRITPP